MWRAFVLVALAFRRAHRESPRRHNDHPRAIGAFFENIPRLERALLARCKGSYALPTIHRFLDLMAPDRECGNDDQRADASQNCNQQAAARALLSPRARFSWPPTPTAPPLADAGARFQPPLDGGPLPLTPRSSNAPGWLRSKPQPSATRRRNARPEASLRCSSHPSPNSVAGPDRTFLRLPAKLSAWKTSRRQPKPSRISVGS